MANDDETKIMPVNNGNGVSIIKKLAPIASVVAVAVCITVFLLTMIYAAERKACDAQKDVDALKDKVLTVADELKYIRIRVDAIADKVGAKKQ